MTTPPCPRCKEPLCVQPTGKVWCNAKGSDGLPCGYGNDAPRTLVPQPDAVALAQSHTITGSEHGRPIGADEIECRKAMIRASEPDAQPAPGIAAPPSPCPAPAPADATVADPLAPFTEGTYECRCCLCHARFIGGKRAVVCPTCINTPVPATVPAGLSAGARETIRRALDLHELMTKANAEPCSVGLDMEDLLAIDAARAEIEAMP